MTPRFLAPALDAASAEVALPPEEALHLARVLRLGLGARVRVFDGRGNEWNAEVATVSRAAATVRLLGTAVPAPELRRSVSLAIAVLKGEKMDDVVRDAAMLGVASVTPLVTARTEVSLAALQRGTRAERWRRIAVASVKQCGRAVVPEVEEPLPIEHYCARPAAAPRAALVEPSAETPSAHLRELCGWPRIELVIGPEGGWTVGELQALSGCGVVAVRLGGRTLRADAVPIVAVSAWLALAGEI